MIKKNKKLFTVLCLLWISSAPAKADQVIASLSDSRIDEVHYTVRNRFGVPIETITKVQHFVYLDDKGEKVDLDYKINARTTDQRHLIKKLDQYMIMKHPIIYGAGKLIFNSSVGFYITVP